MLPKRRRLTKVQVREVLKQGSRTRGALLSMRYVAGVTPFAVSVVAPKAVAKSAVARNRLRRAAYRALALAPLPRQGRAVLFVDKVPPGPLTPAFVGDLARVLPAGVQ